MHQSRVLDHAEPFEANTDARTAVLLCHGFTGSPWSMLPWARALAGAGLRVDVPRLPGHGTHWREMNLTRWTDWYAVVEQRWARLEAECDQVFVAGMSMGGSLALRLAEQHDVAGVMLVNPAVVADHPKFRALPVLRHVVPATSSIANDIALPGQDEHAYDRTPLHAAWSMTQLWRVVERDLGRVDTDVLLMTSRVDHVVGPGSRALLLDRLPRVVDVRLDDSLHVATLDHDAQLVFDRSLEFIRDHAGGGR